MAEPDLDKHFIGTYLTKTKYEKFKLSAISRGTSRCNLLRKLALELIDRDKTRIAGLEREMSKQRGAGK
jgi:hypothetical protein